jgi:hypothetical protein
MDSPVLPKGPRGPAGPGGPGVPRLPRLLLVLGMGCLLYPVAWTLRVRLEKVRLIAKLPS